MISVDRLDAAVALVDRFIGEGVPGVGLIVAEHGEIVGEYYAGLARPDRPADVDTLWPLASISKLYAAAGCMAAIEEGRIALSTKAATIFPEFTLGGRDKITLRHLLTHTSGLPYESDQMANVWPPRSRSTRWCGSRTRATCSSLRVPISRTATTGSASPA